MYTAWQSEQNKALRESFTAVGEWFQTDLFSERNRCCCLSSRFTLNTCQTLVFASAHSLPKQEGCLGRKSERGRDSQPNALVLGDLRRVFSPARQGGGGSGYNARVVNGGAWDLRAPNVVRAVVENPQEVIIT